MKEILEQYSDCRLCPLANLRGQPGYENIVFYKGPEKADVMIVGEAPGSEEAKEGRPFIGKAGKLLDDLLTECGFIPGDIHVTNTCLCRPPDNRPPHQREIAACMQRLAEQIIAVDPKFIILLGNSALSAVVGKTGITAYRGVIGGSDEKMGGQLRTRMIRALGSLPKNFMIGATFHPSSVFRGSDFERNNKIAAIKTDLGMFKRCMDNDQRCTKL
jgi:uracil-DNA glycosylase family 4